MIKLDCTLARKKAIKQIGAEESFISKGVNSPKPLHMIPSVISDSMQTVRVEQGYQKAGGFQDSINNDYLEEAF